MFFPRAGEEWRKEVIISGGRGVRGFVVIFSSLNTTPFTFVVIYILV
jgi:hypothetical protein